MLFLQQSGLQLWHDGQFQKAIEVLELCREKARKIEPGYWFDSAECNRRIAECLVELGDLKEAETYATIAIEDTERAFKEADTRRMREPKRLQERLEDIELFKIPEDRKDRHLTNPSMSLYEPVDCRVLLGKVLHQLGGDEKWKRARGNVR